MKVDRITSPYTHLLVYHPPHRWYLVTSLVIALLVAIILVLSATFIVGQILNRT